MKESPLDAFFKFKIADMVCVTAQSRLVYFANKQREKWEKWVPQIAQIVERHLVECSGGIQANYSVRLSGGAYQSGAFTAQPLFPFNEIELEPAPGAAEPLDTEGASDARPVAD